VANVVEGKRLGLILVYLSAADPDPCSGTDQSCSADDDLPPSHYCNRLLRHRTSALRPAGADVIDERRGFQKYGVHIADRVLLKKQELRLLAPLPFRDVLKTVDVPPNELAQLGRRLLRTGEGGGVL
jgi:hypothetical protein